MGYVVDLIACQLARDGQQQIMERRWSPGAGHFLEAAGGVDLVVANAGSAIANRVREGEAHEVARLINVNLVGVTNTLLPFVPGMIEQGRGTLCAMSSFTAHRGLPGRTAYGASKAAVRQLTKTVAVHCGRKGYRIRCNSVHPGVIQTSMGDQVMALGGGNVEQKWAARIAAIPLGEAGTVHDVARCVLFLASDEAPFMSGHAIVIDGGELAGGLASQ